MHWKHSRFDIAYLILGNCHTVDEAYRVLCELEEDRQMAISISLSESKRAQAKVVGAKIELSDPKESQVNKLRAESYIMETEARTKITQAALDEARRELSFIQGLKDSLNPHRMFKDHADHYAHQLIQPIEWKFDILWQMYSQMVTHSGQINDEVFLLIRMHPDSNILLGALDILFKSAKSDFTAFMKMPKQVILETVAKEEEKPFLLSTSNFNPQLLQFMSTDSIAYKSLEIIDHEIY